MAGPLPPLDSEYPLDAHAVLRFRRDGHALIRGLASREEVAAYRPHIARVLDGVAVIADRQQRLDDYSSLFTQVTNVWRMDEAAKAFVFARRFAQVAARLMGVGGVRLYHDQALFKEPGGAPTPWHQDQYYWPLDTEHTVTMWMALVDIPPEMGPMSFASGSHRADVASGAISAEESARLSALIHDRRLPVSEPTALAAGDATFHSGRTLHSAQPNRTARRREVMTVIYYEDGVLVAHPENPHQEVDLRVFLPGLRGGDVADTELNPRLYP
ncbi:MAG TPA: phytanoyl-CoA dioxygenase family protein [Vicinamibacteria bacterium]|nr:phytanoyl-CoA dioxygenase family protein [Vicinamibacteria bacterium]